MPTKSILRRVKPALHDDSDEEDYGGRFGNHPRDEDVDEHHEEDDDEDEDDEMRDYDDENSDEDANEEDEADEIDPAAVLSQTSFGTLAKAESSIAKERNRSKTEAATTETTKADRISAVKSQLQALKSTPSLTRNKTAIDSNNDPVTKVVRPWKTSPPPKRASKSAPAEQTSKKPVSRYREAVEVNIPKARDPRFDSAAGLVNESQFKKNYSFLNEYKEKEIGALKEEIAKAKRKSKKGGDASGDVQEMERTLKRMESQKQTQEAKDQTASLVAEHKKKERELIKQGKTPYFLKKSEQKKMVLMDRYSKLGEKELDRVLARKRKHKAAKERKNMPWARRGTEA